MSLCSGGLLGSSTFPDTVFMSGPLDSAWQNLYAQVATAETQEELEKAIELCERFAALSSSSSANLCSP